MNYPYPIPGVTVAAGTLPPTFDVGNLSVESCGCACGSITVDAASKTLIAFDYTDRLPTGVSVSTIKYTVTQPAVEMLVVTDITLTNNVSTFQVSGGVIGTDYTVESTAQLTTGELWIDNITVKVVNCGASPYDGPGLLYGLAPVIISATLYYNAIAQQIVFDLAVPDKFGRTGTLIDGNVNVYANGTRLVPNDSYLVDINRNRVTLVWPAGVGESVVIDILTVPPPPVPAPPLGATIRQEVLLPTALNTLPNLTYAPDGNVLMLTVNGVALYAVGPDAAFTVSGKTLTWTSSVHSVPMGAAVIAVYTYA